MPKINLGRVKGDPLRYEDLTEAQKLELKGEKGDMPVIKAGTTTIVNFDQNAKVTSETNGDVTSFNFQIPVGQKPPFYGAYADFPETGDIDRMYIDNTVVPRLMYTWDETDGYVLTSGTDGLSIDIDPENTDTYTENEGEQTAEYKLVNAHPVISGVIDKLAYFRTHASAVWYNKLAGITVLQKLNELSNNIKTLSQNIGTLSQLSTTSKANLVAAINEQNENLTAKINMTDVANNVTTTAVGKVLDARQGKILNDSISGKVSTSNIVNNLTTTASGKVLDARQGKILNDGLSKKQNTLSVNTFVFSHNPAGITSSSINCYQYGNICIINGNFQPNQAGTPLALGSFAKRPVHETIFIITSYERVASYGSIDTAGTFKCNIPNAMANVTCAVNFTYITND